MKINYKIDAENESFYIMENPKTSGIVERRFPREYQCLPLSNDGFKIISLENQLQIYAGKIDDHTIEGESFTDVFEFCKKLAEVIYASSGGSTTGKSCDKPMNIKDCDRQTLIDKLDEQLTELKSIKTELSNDDAYNLFEDTDGNVLWGKLSDDGTTYKYYKADGSEYTGVVKPYSREVIPLINDYCANGVPFSRIEFRDADTKEVLSVIWRNDNDFSEGIITPAGATKGICTVATEFNTNEHWRVTGSAPPAPFDTDDTDGSTKTFSADSFHSLDLVVENGIVKVEINNKVFSHQKGFSQSYDASNLLANDIIVTQGSDDCVCTIVTIK